MLTSSLTSSRLACSSLTVQPAVMDAPGSLVEQQIGACSRAATSSSLSECPPLDADHIDNDTPFSRSSRPRKAELRALSGALTVHTVYLSTDGWTQPSSPPLHGSIPINQPRTQASPSGGNVPQRNRACD